MFTEKFVEILQERAIKPYHISKSTGISAGLMSEYANGVKLPTLINFVKIADYLNCSADFLLNRDNYLNSQKEKNSYSEFSDNELEMILLFKCLNLTQQGKIIERARMMLEAEEEKAALLKEKVS